MRRFPLLALPLLCALLSVPAEAAGASWTSDEVTEVRTEISRLLAGCDALRGAHVGLEIAAADGAVLYERNADDDFVPASNAKLVTGSAALERLGPDFRFTTTLSATAPIADGAIAGDLVLRGGGDPLLRAADLNAAAEALAARGVRAVRGGIVLDDTAFDARRYGAGWVIDDLPYDYAAPIDALSVDEDAVHLRVAPGQAPGASPSIDAAPASDAYVVRNAAVTGAAGSDDTLDLERGRGEEIRVVGSIPLGAGSRTLDAAVADGAVYAGDLLRRALLAHGVSVAGVSVRGATPAGASVLWTHDSEPLRRLLADFWYPSDNHVGEALLKELGLRSAGAPGRDDAGIAVETAWLRAIGVDPATISLSDGSGLSRYDAFTPRAFVAVLRHDWNASYRDVVLDALPVAGVRGTLARRFLGTAAQGRVFAKTGGMLNVTNLSGYVATRTHGMVIFSLLIDDALGEDAPIEEFRARVLSLLSDA